MIYRATTSIKGQPAKLMVPMPHARKSATKPALDTISIDSSDEESVASTDDVKGPSNELLFAVKHLSYDTLRLQKAKRLPFLRRSLRKGFLGRCLQNGVNTHGHKLPNPRVTVVYRLNTTVDEPPDEYVAHTASWLCPLCELHGRFGTREMLQKHLWWDHREVDVVWNKESVIISTSPQVLDCAEGRSF
jgi:hypothetical protein